MKKFLELQHELTELKTTSLTAASNLIITIAKNYLSQGNIQEANAATLIPTRKSVEYR